MCIYIYIYMHAGCSFGDHSYRFSPTHPKIDRNKDLNSRLDPRPLGKRQNALIRMHDPGKRNTSIPKPPETLKSKPKPSSLNPEHYTLSPEPQTQNPKP